MRKTEHQQRVEEFMVLAKQDIPDWPTIPDEKTLKLRARLILEEAVETIHAMGLGILVGDEKTWLYKDVEFSKMLDQDPILEEIVDGCTDIMVVTTGTLSACGISDDSVQREVDINNLAKFKHVCPGCGKDFSDHPEHHAIPSGRPGDMVCSECGVQWRSGFRDEHGKWVKPENHEPPRIAEVIEKQRKAADE